MRFVASPLHYDDDQCLLVVLAESDGATLKVVIERQALEHLSRHPNPSRDDSVLAVVKNQRALEQAADLAITRRGRHIGFVHVRLEDVLH